MANNILFILTDQERYFPEPVPGLSLPARERLASEGVSFERHYIASTVCTSSRAVIYTGLHMPVTRMFDNANFPFVDSMSPGLPTMGTRFRRAGYTTAYKGKWHLTHDLPSEIDSSHRQENRMEQYGFSDWNPGGDIIADPWDGYRRDLSTTAAAAEWLRTRGAGSNNNGEPWLLAVNLVNPHDVMYFSTDLPGQPVQTAQSTLMKPHPAPEHDNYRVTYPRAPIPASWRQAIDAEGRPRAHAEYQLVMSHVLGAVPAEQWRWERFRDYYLNCLAEVDRKIEFLLDELEALGMHDSTVVVLTSDHGEMQGAHGLRGKGGNAYEESIHVPLTIRAPGGRRGARCHAVTSHVDLIPTLAGLADVSSRAMRNIIADLPGKDASAMVLDEAAAGERLRPGAVFAASNIIFQDGEFVGRVMELRDLGRSSEQIRAELIAPNLSNRCFIRTMFDGRHKLSRYFSPLEHHRATSIEELLDRNDVELFDLIEDPEEMRNLAVDAPGRAPLLEELNKKLTYLLDTEIGAYDDGRYLPAVPGMSWAAPDLVNV